ncbi:MAG: PPOX class F420-dependent oxidoreductase [Actinomycetota bacterium]
MNNNIKAISEISTSKCISLTTFKRDGTKISTPIWFNVIGEKIYVTTEPGAWKVKRIANNPNVEFAACTQRGKVTGQTFGGTARILPPVELAAVIAAKKRRYATFRLIHLFKKDQVAVEITLNV